eukprot:jgi/Tetstr1/444237/TSEL_032130.t1
MHHKAGYWLRNCLPSEVEAFAEAVDATVLAAVEQVLGVSLDPFKYGTDTNPVVTDFLAELLHDSDPMASEAATLSEDAMAMARSMLHLPTRSKGVGIRRMATVGDAAFIGCMNDILPGFLSRNSDTNTPTPDFFDPHLGSVLGRGSFNATSSARRYDHFLSDARGSASYAAAVRGAWGRFQAANDGHLIDADAHVMEREAEAAGRILFNELDAASGMWRVAIPTAWTVMTPYELREVAAGYFLMPSPPCLAPVFGSYIILPSTEHNPVIDDLYGDAFMNLPAHGDAKDEFKDVVPDIELSLPAFNVVTGSYDPRSLKSKLPEFKTTRHGVKYIAVPRATDVDRFERSLLGDIQRGLAARDAAWHNTDPGQKAPLRDIHDMLEYTRMVFGKMGPALAVLDGAPKEVGPVPAFQIEDFTPAGGWEEMGSGLLVRVLRPGEGDRAKGIFDRVDHFQPFPFVTVRFTAYEPSGNVFASTIATRRDYNYQAGVRQELQDEDGAVMSMVVGERRQFVVPVELAYKRKLWRVCHSGKWLFSQNGAGRVYAAI